MKQNWKTVWKAADHFPLSVEETEIKDKAYKAHRIVLHQGKSGAVYADSGLLANPIGIVMAEYESQVLQTDGEVDHLEWIAIKDINNYIKENKTIDGISITAIYQYFLQEK